MIKFVALGAGLLLACGCAQSEVLAPATSFPLGASEQIMDVANIGIARDGAAACIVGSGVNDEDAAVHSSVTLADLGQKKTSWTRKIAPPDSTANVYAIACAFQGNHLYVLANADSQRAMANSQSLVYVYKFALNGELLKHAAIPVASRSRVAIDMLAQGNKLTVLGYGKDEDAKNEYYSMFITSFDEALAFQTRVMKDGGYSQYSAVRQVGNHLHIGGEFLPKSISKDDLPLDYAISTIKQGGGYLWSTRPKHKFVTASDNIATAVGTDGAAYSLSQNRGDTSLIGVDANGNAAPARTFKSRFCKVKTFTGDARGLLAIRESCPGAKRKNTLVRIDPAAATEQPLDILGAAPAFITTTQTHWYGVGASAGKLTLSFGMIEGR